jgi:hypothetical protein
MRMLLRVRMDTAKGNKAIEDRNIAGAIKDFVDKYHPEAAYFFADRGKRAASFVIDMQDSSQIPVLAEPFFMGLEAEVEFVPVMNLDDLQKGLSAFMS